MEPSTSLDCFICDRRRHLGHPCRFEGSRGSLRPGCRSQPKCVGGSARAVCRHAPLYDSELSPLRKSAELVPIRAGSIPARVRITWEAEARLLQDVCQPRLRYGLCSSLRPRLESPLSLPCIHGRRPLTSSDNFQKLMTKALNVSFERIVHEARHPSGCSSERMGAAHWLIVPVFATRMGSEVELSPSWPARGR